MSYEISDTSEMRKMLLNSYYKLDDSISTQAFLGEKCLEQIKDPDISLDDLLWQIACAYGSNEAHSNRLYDYFQKGYYCLSSPSIANVPQNGKPYKGAPISCFLSECNSENLNESFNETMYVSSLGGGLGSDWSGYPSIFDTMPFSGRNSFSVIYGIKAQGHLMRLFTGAARKVGSVACYLNVDHADIENFIIMRKNVSGSDPDFQVPRYVNHGVNISDAFMECVVNNKDWALKDITGNIVKVVSARDLFLKIISTRMETGEPFIHFCDTSNKCLRDYQKNLGLKIKTSNLCTEIVLPTGKDHLGRERTAVCNLGSFNLTFFDEWKDNYLFFKDILEMMDNICTYFIYTTPTIKLGQKIDFLKPFGTVNEWRLKEEEIVEEAWKMNHPAKKAVYSAYRAREIGIGTFGFATYLQSKAIPFESEQALSINENIYYTLKKHLEEANRELTIERGECPDSIEGKGKEKRRFSTITAIAPTVTITNITRHILAKTKPLTISPSIEPLENIVLNKGQIGFHLIKNEFLECFLQSQSMNNEKIWNRIANDRTVKNIVPKEIAEIFKSPIEIDQKKFIDLAAQRQKYIDQAQSINLSFFCDVEIKQVVNTVIHAWRSGVKLLYYHRSNEAMQAGNTFFDTEAVCAGCQ